MMTNVSKVFRAGLTSLAAVMALSACSTDMGDLNQYLAEVKARPATPIEPIPPVKTYQPYEYDGTSGRDPFRSSSSEGREVAQAGSSPTAAGPRPDFERSKEYLERFELDTLTMVGTFGQDGNYWGLIRDPDGVVHRVSLEDFLGKNHGQIVGIEDAEIMLSELITDGSGGWLQREASIALEGG
ncbi:MAG: pilus assembly protein PilP [Pseudomonadota bacterium]